MAYGLPVIRENEKFPMVMDHLHRQVPTCRLDESLGQVGTRAQQYGFNVCPVVNDNGVVLGLVGRSHWDKDPTASVEQLMEPGPTTLRPSHPLQEAEDTLQKSGLGAVLVTNSDGKLLGVFLGQSKNNEPRKQQLPESEVWS
jgi:CBS domain-containing protein